VTTEIAGHIAELASALEEAGHKPEVVAKFLMRVLFTMFAEDVGLLRDDLFTHALEQRWCKDPASFPREVEALWTAMNTGGELFMAGRILQFNGGLFSEPKALPLDATQLRTLHAAAKSSWADVEPAIFGTLLERALDDRERHALGAHYTPRAYVERLVRPTIEEPLRREWDDVRVEARLLASGGKLDEARAAVGGFHRQLCTLRVLDPACGTGNFLYVALDTFKRVESEVLALLSELGDTQALLGPRVSPAQFLGIEVKPWAREIAELVLWIGHLSWNARIYGKAAAKEPVLESYGNIECRDAILAWDSIEPLLDDAGQPVRRWDGVSVKRHPATGKLVPDEEQRTPVMRYVNPRVPAWPAADFVVGNPPYIGKGRMRTDLGDGYVEALRAAHRDVPDSADLVMYFWDRAAKLTNAKALIRFGFITTNSITQAFNRRVLEAHMVGADAVSIVYAIPNHPWPGDADSAAVRVAMTVGEAGMLEGVLETVTAEREIPNGAPEVTLVARRGHPPRRPDHRGECRERRPAARERAPVEQRHAPRGSRLPSDGGGPRSGGSRGLRGRRQAPPALRRWARPDRRHPGPLGRRLLRAHRGRESRGLSRVVPVDPRPGEARAGRESAGDVPGSMVGVRGAEARDPRGARGAAPVHRDHRNGEAPALSVPRRSDLPGPHGGRHRPLRRLAPRRALFARTRRLGTCDGGPARCRR
jgi:hypothetical protein